MRSRLWAPNLPARCLSSCAIAIATRKLAIAPSIAFQWDVSRHVCSSKARRGNSVPHWRRPASIVSLRSAFRATSDGLQCLDRSNLRRGTLSGSRQARNFLVLRFRGRRSPSRSTGCDSREKLRESTTAFTRYSGSRVGPPYRTLQGGPSAFDHAGCREWLLSGTIRSRTNIARGTNRGRAQK